jgi:hypothetical protein
MPALVAGIHAFLEFAKQDVDARHKAGHDGGEVVARNKAGHDGREAVRFNSSWPGIKPFVMAGLVPAIHVFGVATLLRRGCPA